mmetsp:Transcript_6969/g.12483  ORF Transcript_6969/g.12483 Transcript_6969/m.12483 type:complete len:263 (-) Transcript_6969:214-1002(-)
MVELFERVGLHMNTKKTVTMVCVPWKIRTPHIQEVHDNGRQGIITLDEWQCRHIQCEHCGGIAPYTHGQPAWYLPLSWVLNKVLTEEEEVLPVTQAAYLSKPVDMLYCPYPGCTEDPVNEANHGWHFAAQYPNDLVSTPRDGCPPKCGRCGLQVKLKRRMSGHVDTKQCNEGGARQVQHKAAAMSIRTLDARFTAYGEKLERVEVSKNLGLLLVFCFCDNNTQAMRGNLKKAPGVWARLSRVLRWENASPHVCGVFYKATLC